MTQLPLAVHLPSFRKPLPRALQLAARLGVQGVELDAREQVRPREMGPTALRHLKRLLQEHRLGVSAVAFPTRRGYNVEDGLDRRVEATRQAMELAYRLGAPVVVNYVGQLPEKPEGPDWDLLVEVLTDLGRWGQRVGALLAARTGPDPPQRLAQLLQTLPEGSLLVDLDPGLLVMHGHSVTEAVEQLGPWIAHVHARDGARDLALGHGVEVPLGRGSVDFEHLLGLLAERDYRGYLTIQRDQAERPQEEIELAVQFLRRLGQ